MPNGRNRSVNSKKRNKRDYKREERDSVSPCPLNLIEPDQSASSSSLASTSISYVPLDSFKTALSPNPRRSTRSAKPISSSIPASGQEAFKNWPEEHRAEGSSETGNDRGNLGNDSSSDKDIQEDGSSIERGIEPKTPSHSSLGRYPHRATYHVSPDTDDGSSDNLISAELPATSPSPSRLPVVSSDTAAPDPGAWDLSSPAYLPASSPLTPPPLSQTSLSASKNPSSLDTCPRRTPQPDPNSGPPRSASTTPTQRHQKSPVGRHETEAGTGKKEEEGGCIGLKEVEEEARRFSAESSPLTPVSSQSDRFHSPYPSIIGAAIASRLQPAPTPTITSTEFCRISPSAVDADSYPLPEGSTRLPRSVNLNTFATTASPPKANRPVRGRPDLPVIALEPRSEPVTPLLLTPTVETGSDRFPPHEPIVENFGSSTEPQSASPLLTAYKQQVHKDPKAEPVRKEKGKKRTINNFSSIPTRRKSARLSGLSTSVPNTAVAQSFPDPNVHPPESVALSTLTSPSLQRDPSIIQIEKPEVSPRQDPPSSPLTRASPSPEPTQPNKADIYQNNLNLFNLDHFPIEKLSRHASVRPTLGSKCVERGTSCAPTFLYLGPDRYFPAPAELSTECIVGGQEDTEIETREIQEDTEVGTKEVSVTAPVKSPRLVTRTFSALLDTSPQKTLAKVSDTSDLPPPSVAPAPTPTTPDIITTLSASRSKRNRSPTPPPILSGWNVVPEPSFPQPRAEIMSAKRQRTDTHFTPNAVSTAGRAPSPSSTQSSLSPAPDSPAKEATTPSIAPIKLKLSANDESKGGPDCEADQAKEKAESAVLMENTESVLSIKTGGTRGTKRKSTIVDSIPSTLTPEQPAPKITLKLGGKRATASAESTTPAHSPPPPAVASVLGTSEMAGPSKSGGNKVRQDGKKGLVRAEDANLPPAKRRGRKTSSRANTPVRSDEGQAANSVEGKAGEITDVPGPTILQEDVIMREEDTAPDPPTPTTAPIVHAGKGRPGRTRPKRIVDSPEAESSSPGPTVLTALPESTSAAEPVSQPTPVPVPHQDPTPPVSAAPTPPGGSSPKALGNSQGTSIIESIVQEKTLSQPQTQTPGREADKAVNEPVKGESKKSAVGKFKKKAGVSSVSTPGDPTGTPKKASAPSTPTATPTPATGPASAKSTKSAKPPPSTSTPKVTPLPKKTAAGAVGSASKLGPRSSTGTPSTSTPIAASSNKPVAAPSSLLAATLSQLKQAPSSASKQDGDVKRGKKEMPKIQKVERFPVYARKAKEEEEYAASAEERAKERARREGYKKNALNLSLARDTYKLDSMDKHRREIDVSGHMGIITSGMPIKILKHIFGQDAVPHGMKQAQEEAADAERARAEGREPDVWEEDDEDDPEWPVRRDEDWFFDWKSVKSGT